MIAVSFVRRRFAPVAFLGAERGPTPQPICALPQSINASDRSDERYMVEGETFSGVTPPGWSR